jgi:hypothetical protein
MSLQRFETWLLLMPPSPIACTRSSTLRVETPAIQASWMTGISAFPVVLRASRKGGKQLPVLSFGMRRFSSPSRVSSVRSR